jgi:glycosyltransferase involved in cell wall biosynthesis
MRIAQIAPPWTPVPPPLYGGIELVVDRLCRGLVDAGHEVMLYTTGDSTCPVPKQWVLPHAEGMRIGMAVPELRHVVHAYDAVQDFDIVHDHSVFGPLYAERFPHLKVVTTIHGPFNDELTDLYARMAGRVPIICISHDQRSCAPEVPVARVIHHGIDASDFPFGEGKGGYLLFLGRMAPEKGAHRAAQVARLAGVPLLMAAKMREPWERDYFEREVEGLLSPKIRYLGEVPHEEKLQLLADAAALLNPIRWHEPFGLVMTEALACGTPVISFAEGAAPEIIDHGKTGFLCDDEAEMVEAVSRLAEIDRQACRSAVEGYFSTRRMVDDHLELYESMLAEEP